MTDDKNVDFQKMLGEDKETVFRCGACGELFEEEKSYMKHHMENHQQYMENHQQ